VNEFNCAGAKASKPQNFVTALSGVSADIDAEAARRFSIYAQAARTKGYDFQAYLIERKMLPPVQQKLADIAAERVNFNSMVAPNIEDIRPKDNKWEWKSMAIKVGRVDEYNYIYTFASKLLHATPASITTDHKNLEAQEMELFLKYIDVTIGDVMTLAGVYQPGVIAC
jgi:hypothetical protein